MGSSRSIFLWISVISLLSQSLLLPLATAAAPSNPVEAQKTYYSPPAHDPHSPHSPSHGGGGSPTPVPSHGGSGGCGCTPTTPSHHGGSYHSPPSSPAYIPPPSTVTPPATPITPSPPVPVDPGSSSGPFPCTYWASHPGLIWGVLGWWGTVGGVFGVATLPGVHSDPSSMSIQHALTNTNTDGYSALYREAAASFLNSMAAPKNFPFTTSQVRSSFVSALHSDKAAASQARVFRLANEGRLKLV